MLIIRLYDVVNGYQIQRLYIFFECVEFEKVYVTILASEIFKIVGGVLNIEPEEKYFIKYFFQKLERNFQSFPKLLPLCNNYRKQFP